MTEPTFKSVRNQAPSGLTRLSRQELIHEAELHGMVCVDRNRIATIQGRRAFSRFDLIRQMDQPKLRDMQVKNMRREMMMAAQDNPQIFHESSLEQDGEELLMSEVHMFTASKKS
ncbi:hypothetical protein [Thalassobius sp. Cn5-15]|uniref:hypothetical protein n=1 Tax=Thalassobius sp. Cn5-15 TaxID=2917763 RepID=UPI001EF305BC|nr:hypothetical protein [Thalassobius sp. Cn5-15]MCG7492406.1 hypothetical protein [Thalassobius sp. Cn5-15]